MPARLSEMALVFPFPAAGCSGPPGGLSFCACVESLRGVFGAARGAEDDGAVGGSRELLLDGESCRGASVGSGVKFSDQLFLASLVTSGPLIVGGMESAGGGLTWMIDENGRVVFTCIECLFIWQRISVQICH